MASNTENFTFISHKDIERSSKKTAIQRRMLDCGERNISVPLKKLLRQGFIEPGIRVLDYGCGHGNEVKYLNSIGVEAVGYDINFESYKKEPAGKFDVVLCSYVLCTVTSASRHEIIKKILQYSESSLVCIATRSTQNKVKGAPHEDGVLTSIGTFQKLFTPEELTDLLQPYFQSIQIISRNPVIAICREET